MIFIILNIFLSLLALIFCKPLTNSSEPKTLSSNIPPRVTFGIPSVSSSISSIVPNISSNTFSVAPSRSLSISINESSMASGMPSSISLNISLVPRSSPNGSSKAPPTSNMSFMAPSMHTSTSSRGSSMAPNMSQSIYSNVPSTAISMPPTISNMFSIAPNMNPIDSSNMSFITSNAPSSIDYSLPSNILFMTSVTPSSIRLRMPSVASSIFSRTPSNIPPKVLSMVPSSTFLSTTPIMPSVESSTLSDSPPSMPSKASSSPAILAGHRRQGGADSKGSPGGQIDDGDDMDKPPDPTKSHYEHANEKFTLIETTTKIIRRTLPYRYPYTEQCDYIRHYCLKTYDTGRICGRTMFYTYSSFQNYCMLDFVNCVERYELWQLVHMGECYFLKDVTDYQHYEYNDDFFLDTDTVKMDEMGAF